MDMATPIATVSADLGQSLAVVVLLGIGAQWLAGHLRAPSILVLLVTGVVAGPGVTGLVEPDELLGDLLFPVVSLAVGILLFEGALNLRFHELERQGAGPVIRLVSIGALLTWVVAGLATRFVVGLGPEESALLGAVLVVSGPTVMLPLLRFARVREPVNNVLRWEGIVIDPIGATVAVVVLRAVVGGHGPASSAGEAAATGAAGVAMGLVGAGALTLAFSRHWVPDALHNAVTLAVVVGAFAGADALRPEAGLFATTVMGVALANQRWAHVGHIREFEDNLGTLILGSLFVLLGANVDVGELADWAPEALGLLACLVFVARPAAVWVSTVGSGLTTRERAYLAIMAPRGIVAASVSAVFALELAAVGRPLEALVPVTFIVIVGTVVLYGLAARPVARWLHVARPEPTGVVFFGGPAWAIELGAALSDRDVPVLVVTRDHPEAAAAAERGLLTYTGRLDADDLRLALDSVGARIAIAASQAQELNAYGVNRAIGALGRANVYYLPGHDAHGHGEADAVTRRPFGHRFTQADIAAQLAAGGRIVTVAGRAGAASGPRPVPGGQEPGGASGPAGPGYEAQVPEGALTLVTVSAAGVPTVPHHETLREPPVGGAGIYLVPPPGRAAASSTTAPGRVLVGNVPGASARSGGASRPARGGASRPGGSRFRRG